MLNFKDLLLNARAKSANKAGILQESTTSFNYGRPDALVSGAPTSGKASKRYENAMDEEEKGSAQCKSAVIESRLPQARTKRK